ncbi:MAG: class I SAM-dependent methyltransferase [Candidatus Scalindua sp.]
MEKFLNRYENHWQYHIKLAKQLVAEYALPPSASLLDLGCSIGTFALEFALDGYDTIGLDFDSKALEQGKHLAKELGCNPKWICEDASSFCLEEKVDTVVCFDLLEHLDDNNIVNLLSCVKKSLKLGGIFIFHTFPTTYDHIFYMNPLTCLPLIPFRSLSKVNFEILVHWYAKFLDVFYLLRYGKTHKGVIAKTVHPNPLSKERLQYFIKNAGLNILLLEMSLDSVNPLKPGQGVLAKKFFANQPVAFRSIWGVARNPAPSR